MNVKKVKELIKLFKEEELTKLKIEEKGMKIHIEKGGDVQSSAPVSGSEQCSGGTGVNKAETLEIKEPQVGTFYMQKEEESDENIINAGAIVQKGIHNGLIELMKVKNDVNSVHAVVIEEILVENGDTIEYDQVLMTVRKEGE